MTLKIFIRLFQFALALLFLLVCLWPGQASAEGELVRALKNREEFYKSETRLASRAEWLALIKEFEEAGLAQYDPRHASRARYLGSDLALDSALKFKQKGDYETAERLSRRAVRDCPRCTHSAAAQLISGRALMALGRLDEADKQLMKVELSYPDSPEVTRARQLLAEIRGGPPPSPQRAASASQSQVAPARRPGEVKAPPSVPTPAGRLAENPAVKPPPPPKPRADGQAQVYFLTLTDQGRHTTVTAYLDKVTPYVYNLIPPAKNGGAFRVYADLKGAVIAPKSRLQLKENSQLVRLVKMNQFQNDVVRVVLDMPEANPYRPTFLDNPPRLVFQVAKEASNLPSPTAEAQPEPAERPARKAEPDKVARPVSGPVAGGPAESLARQLGLKVKTVVIDPGHGGKDGGASAFGLKEKDLVLKLAKKLAVRIEKRLGLTVHLTRSDDRFITLERRTKIAKDKRGDLFISLHVNANKIPSVEGFETYILNLTTDRSAMAVAARENASSDKSIAELQDILQIIAKNTKIAESRAMAQAIHKAAVRQLNKKYRVRDLGVKEAPFYVLVGTDIPSILVEIGFLTNEKEAARISQEAYLDQIADGLVNGLESYVKGF